MSAYPFLGVLVCVQCMYELTMTSLVPSKLTDLGTCFLAWHHTKTRQVTCFRDRLTKSYRLWDKRSWLMALTPSKERTHRHLVQASTAT